MTRRLPAVTAVCLMVASAVQGQEGPPAAAPPVAVAVAVSPGLTFSFDITPEFYASSKAGSYELGDLADTEFRLGLSKALGNGLTLAGSLSQTVRVPSGGSGSSYNQLEGVIGSKWQVSPEVSIPVSATLGYAFGEEPKIDPTDPDAPEAYYAINVAADWKVGEGLTWNVVNLRYRDAFNQDWVTPKLATGLTYAMSPTGTVYGSVGKSWKDTGTGMLNDKFSIGLGLKLQF